jgi:uncharacterized membrane protein
VRAFAGARREWDAKIVDQQPDRMVSWVSTSGANNGGIVTFEPIDATTTRVGLELDFEPDGVVETLGDKLGFVRRRAQNDLERFKEFIEARGQETGAWRDRIDAGRVDQTGALGRDPDQPVI